MQARARKVRRERHPHISIKPRRPRITQPPRKRQNPESTHPFLESRQSQTRTMMIFSVELANMSALLPPTATAILMVTWNGSRALALERMKGGDRVLGPDHARHLIVTTIVDTMHDGMTDMVMTVIAGREVGKIDPTNEIDMATTHLATINQGADPGRPTTIGTAVILGRIATAEQKGTTSTLHTNGTSEMVDIDKSAAGVGSATTGQTGMKAIEPVHIDKRIAGHHRVPAHRIVRNNVEVLVHHRLADRCPHHDTLAAARHLEKTQARLLNRSDLLHVRHHLSTSMRCGRCLIHRDCPMGKTTHTAGPSVQANPCELWVSPLPTFPRHENCWRWMQSPIKLIRNVQTRRNGERHRGWPRKRVQAKTMMMTEGTRTGSGRSLRNSKR